MYAYRIERGRASVCWVNEAGEFSKPRTLCQGKSDDEARQVCEQHYEKAVRMAVNSGRAKPARIDY